LEKQKLGKLCIQFSLVWLFVFSVSPIPDFLVKQWEIEPVADQTFENKDGINILILGGGHSDSPTLPPNNQLSETALKRLSEGIRLYHKVPNSKLICSGYNGNTSVTQAELLARSAVELGVPTEDTSMIMTPANTEEEAKAYFNRFGESETILVTSALHMKRASFWFKEREVPVLPAPTDHFIKPEENRSIINFKPSIRKIEMTNKLIHEWVGMLYAKWKTRNSKNQQ
jgi:uncharacterized SAM-binding protein YcdF (DUF218 family)